MTITEITPDYSVAAQLGVEDVAEAKRLGFRAILDNRPDGEAPGQPDAAAIRAEAERQGLAFAHVPVVSGAITAEDVQDFAAALDALPGPVLAYCRSGTRSRNLWTLARR
jgi:sulfide:quinone oxidoreductase